MVFGLDFHDAVACDARDDWLDHYPVVVGRMTGLRTSFAEGEDAGAEAVDEANFSEKVKIQSPPVQEYAKELQTIIDGDQAKWREGLMGFEAAYNKVHKAQKERMDMYEKLGTRLQRTCEKMRDGLDRLLEAKEMCMRMQEQELPAMFKIKAKDPKRFKRFGKISGCVRLDPDTGLYSANKCECLAGLLSTGCVDAVGKVGNTLSCTHILETELPALPMAQFFQDGGECSIKNNEAWNDAIIGRHAFDHKPPTQQSVMGPEAVSVVSVLLQGAAQHTSASSRQQAPGESALKGRRLSAFL